MRPPEKCSGATCRDNVCGEGRPFCDPGVSAPVTATDDAVVAGHLDGFIRIYNSETGAIVWSFDTADVGDGDKRRGRQRGLDERVGARTGRWALGHQFRLRFIQP